MSPTSVEELGTSLQRFTTPDYAVFVVMLLLCALIGVYFGFCVGKTSVAEYLMGGRNMGTFPVAMSLIASYISGITLLGTPTEIYVYGTQYMYIIGGVILMGWVMSYAFLPVFHDLQLTSTYEYLELRFDKNVRLFGSFLFSISIITWLPIVIYIPALAFNQVTGINVHIITPVVCVVCIFYTCVGGLKAVVWTDVIQTFIMFGAMILVIVKGTMDIGGLQTVWERNYNSGRLEPPNFSVDPYERHTVWVLVLGGFSFWLQSNAVNQAQVQRYLSLQTLQSARRAMWVFVIGCITLICLCCYSGMLIYAKYHDCDPLTTRLALAKDQLLPLLVMDTLGEFPGVPGLFVAGVFSAALSSLSTGLNSMAAVVLEDFYKTFSNRKLTDRQTDILMKTVVVVLGVLCVGLVFVVERLGSVLQMSMSLSGITNGASLGIFCMGLFLPWVNSKGALVGGVAGLGFMAWVCLGTQAAISAGDITFETKPLSVEGCTYNFTAAPQLNETREKNEVFALYRISYLWYSLFGAVVSMVVGLAFSFCTTSTDIRSLDPSVLSPVIRGLMPRRKEEVSGYDNKIDLSDVNVYKTTELEKPTSLCNGNTPHKEAET